MLVTDHNRGRACLTNDSSVLPRLVAALGLEILDLSNDALAINNFAINNMFLIEMWCGDSGNEELRAISA